VRDELPTAPDLGSRQAGDQGPEFIVRNGEEYEVGRRDDLVRRKQWYPGKPSLGPPSRRLRYPARGHNVMPSPG
jgi:hypothetical protein